ncbi:MAG: flagellar hook-length control protein FliK [Clostridiales bacterium]|jgi:flagellar hook-length control protein FliK|nr:flagellar hook-length control protein FliK [Clostridiales bacterium]
METFNPTAFIPQADKRQTVNIVQVMTMENHSQRISKFNKFKPKSNHSADGRVSHVSDFNSILKKAENDDRHKWELSNEEPSAKAALSRQKDNDIEKQIQEQVERQIREKSRRKAQKPLDLKITESLAELLFLLPSEVAGALAALNIQPSDLAHEENMRAFLEELERVNGAGRQEIGEAWTFAPDDMNEVFERLPDADSDRSEIEEAAQDKSARTDISVQTEESVVDPSVSLEAQENASQSSAVPQPDTEEKESALKNDKNVSAESESDAPVLADVDALSMRVREIIEEDFFDKMENYREDTPSDTSTESEGEIGQVQPSETAESAEQLNPSAPNVNEKTYRAPAVDTPVDPSEPLGGNQISSIGADGAEFERSLDIIRARESARPINAPDVLKQIVDTFKTDIKNNVSEMRIALKPETLGDLTMKIVSDNGRITAKFIAESQRVKQIMEADFNILKDTLAKQGLNVTQISVSVGQERKEYQPRGQSSGQSSGKPSGQSSGRSSGRSSRVQRIQSDIVEAKLSPDINLRDSRVSFTA